MTVDENSVRYEGWRVVAAAGTSVFFAALLVYTFAVLLKPLAQEFSWSREAVSTAYGVMALMSALSAAPLGYLADRFTPRRVAIPCLVIFGCLFASLSLLTASLWHFYSVFALLGITATGASGLTYARTVSSWFDRRRGLALAIAISGGSVGGIVHPPIAQALIDAAGWRVTCLAFGGATLAIGVPFVLRHVRDRVAPGDAAATDRLSAGASLRVGVVSRMFWILIVVLFCISLAQNAALVHVSALLTDRGVSAGGGALALSSMGLASVMGRMCTGWLVDRFFAPYVSLAMMVVASAGAFLLSDAQSFAIGAVAAMMIGFGMGGESDVAPYLLSRYFGLRAFSTLYGLTWISVSGAAAVGPVLMGRAFDTTGSYEALLVRLSLVVFGVASLMLAMPRYEKPGVAVQAAAVAERQGLTTRQD